MNLKVAINATL